MSTGREVPGYYNSLALHRWFVFVILLGATTRRYTTRCFPGRLSFSEE
jgi:hypothetical protein